MPNHSTTYQLIDIYHRILLALEQKQHTALVFCDFSKAFDRVWHKGLLLKLEKYGINGKLLLWIKNYLTNRKQCVRITNLISNENSIKAGVPQGSVLGPLLFLLYINDIASSLLSVCSLYADDTSLLFSSTNVLEIEQTLNEDLKVLDNWSKKWLMSFNPKKTNIMIISNIILPYTPTFYLNNIQIPIVKEHKHLWVILSADAKWNYHINTLSKNVNKYISTLRKFKYQL